MFIFHYPSQQSQINCLFFIIPHNRAKLIVFLFSQNNAVVCVCWAFYYIMSTLILSLMENKLKLIPNGWKNSQLGHSKEFYWNSKRSFCTHEEWKIDFQNEHYFIFCIFVIFILLIMISQVLQPIWRISEQSKDPSFKDTTKSPENLSLALYIVYFPFKYFQSNFQRSHMGILQVQRTL